MTAGFVGHACPRLWTAEVRFRQRLPFVSGTTGPRNPAIPQGENFRMSRPRSEIALSPRAAGRPVRTIAGGIAVAGLLLALTGCFEKEQKKPAARGPRPPTAVAVVEVKAERLPFVTELPGRVAPLVSAEVRPRITGIVLRRAFEQGSTVKEGDLLYVIDPQPFQAKVASAKATLDSALAALELARQRADRQAQLLKRGVTSQENSDSAVAALAQGNATVERARADLRTAELELQYTEVRSPISGKIGRALVTEGALVSPTSGVMTVVQQIDPVYADFTQPAASLLALKKAVKEGRLQADESGSAILKLFYAGGQPYPYDGKLLFTESSVNAATGQVILRTEFKNPDRNLLPGMYVRVRIEQASAEGALAVPDQSIRRNTDGKPLVYVVGKENKVEIRPVTLGWPIDNRWIVTKGLSAGDKVIVEGFQKIGPGAPVKPVPWRTPRAGDGKTAKKG